MSSNHSVSRASSGQEVELIESISTELPARTRRIAFSLIAGGMLLSALDGTIVSTALPTIVGNLGGAEHMSWVVTSYLVTLTIASVLGGKFGDLFGRKKIFIVSIVIFTIASMLAGLADSMVWLIAARALQGIGGGGLLVTTTALIADIIPMRDRGKYMGFIGAIFGVTTVIGPLLGGLLTDHLSWRAVFYVNVPVALVIIPLAIRLLPDSPKALRPVIDYWGVLFVALGSSSLILATSWGGTQYAWGSPVIIGLFAGGVICLAIFAFVETRADEPILPLRLFRANVFSASVVLSFIVGFGLIGSMTFLPTFLQYCQGISATNSGLRMLPMVVGLMTASISAGNFVSKTGRYRAFPIVGMLIMGCGMYLLSRMDQDTSIWFTSFAMLVLGTGIGLSMQILTLVVQNTVSYRDLGVATSGVTFFRTMGQAFGAAVFGTVYANQLEGRLASAVVTSGANPEAVTTPAAVQTLPAAQRFVIVSAYAESLQFVFLAAVPTAIIGFIVALILKQVPMRGTASAAADVGPGFAMPDERTDEQRLECMAVEILRRRPPGAVRELTDRCQLSPDHAWVIRQVAIGQSRTRTFADIGDIAHGHRMPTAVIRPAVDSAITGGFVHESAEGLTLTKAGFQGFQRLHESLTDYLRAQFAAAGHLDDETSARLDVVSRRLLLHQVRVLEPATAEN